MPTPDLTGAPVSAPEVEPAAAGAFIPDAGAIERLANAFFQGLTGGALMGTPAAPASPPAPWSAPAQPSAPVYASAVPVRPPFGAPDIPTDGVPSSVPLRSFGGASAGSASPFAFAQSRAMAPAASQTAIAAPRVDPLQTAMGSVPLQNMTGPQSIDRLGIPLEPSPFSAPIDLSLALRALDFAARPNPAASSTGTYVPDAASPPESASRTSDPQRALATPAGVTAGAPSPAIAPVFADARTRPQTFDAATIRNDFPILQERVHGRRLIWLDNGATTQKPQAVIDRLAAFYAHENSNVHRAAHTLAARATDAYEAARDKVRRFIGASSPREIVFVRGATEGINLVAQAWGRRNVKAGDEIVVTWLEHHANIVPWQQLCLETGARLRVAPVDDNGDVLLDEYEKLLGPRTRIVALPQVSNALGTVTPAREMIASAHRHGALTLVDGAQSVSHGRTDVQALDADFFVLSGHKMFAPTGIGAVYGKQAVLETMPPWQGGGSMIADVTFERTVYQVPPDRFEAGTGNIADAVGLGAAIDYLDAIGMEAIARHEHALIEQTVEGLGSIPGLRLVGAPQERAGVVSFVLDGCRTEDIGKALDREGIAVRAGHHCAQPILRRFGLESSVRPSFALYNTADDVEALVAAVRRIALQAQGGSR
jgi:cysteine desulfurase/selenocysteine lyase